MDINQNYREAVKTIKEAILRSQYRAATSVNKEQLSLYYGIGRYVSKNSRIGFWGKGAIEQISSLLQKELPGLRGFSTSNIKNMRVFYEEWESVLNRQPVAGDLELDEKLLLVEFGSQWLPNLIGLTSFPSALVITPKSYPKPGRWKQDYFIYTSVLSAIGANIL